MAKIVNLLTVSPSEVPDFKIPKWLLPDRIETLILGSVSSSSESEEESDNETKQ